MLEIKWRNNKVKEPRIQETEESDGMHKEMVDLCQIILVITPNLMV
jgi:hypothetical protein